MHFLVDLVLSLCAVNVVLLMMNFNPLIKMFEQLSLNNIRIMSASKNGKNFNRFAIWLCHISSYPLNIYMFFFVVSSIALFALDNSKSPQHSAYNVMNTTNNFHTSTLSRISVCTVKLSWFLLARKMDLVVDSVVCVLSLARSYSLLLFPSLHWLSTKTQISADWFEWCT